MTYKKTHNCNAQTHQCNSRNCGEVDKNVKHEGEKNQVYAFYSRVLNKPFDSVAELREAEAAHFTELKAKEDKAATKKADAKKVEDAFKALNQARKVYKEDLTQLTNEYSTAIADLKKAFEAGKSDIHAKLAAAEDDYSKALKEFTDKYESYHLSLKDGDFETTISGSSNNKKVEQPMLDLFDLLFRF
jgi:chromosome segregation ATPase